MLNQAIFRSLPLLRATLTKLITRSCSSGCSTQCRNGGKGGKPSFDFSLLSSVCSKHVNVSSTYFGSKNNAVKLPSLSAVVMEKSDVWFPVDPIGDLPTPSGFPLRNGVVGDAAPPDGDSGKQCARLIKIRRRKMRIHKLKKLRKKLKYVRMAIVRKRKKLKAKKFESEIWSRVQLAEGFNAEAWVEETVRKSFTDPETLVEKWVRPKRPTKYVFPAPSKRR